MPNPTWAELNPRLAARLRGCAEAHARRLAVIENDPAERAGRQSARRRGPPVRQGTIRRWGQANVAARLNTINFFGLQSDSGSWHDPDMANDANSKKNPAAVALGRLGGLKGGKALAAKMTSAQRKASARRAALARWIKRS